MTVAADVTINHVEADHLGHTMMMHDPKNIFSLASSSSVNTVRQETKKLLLPAAVPSLEQELEGTGTGTGRSTMHFFILHFTC